ncbi:DUF917 domain-containing protein [Aerococcus mictus]|uniref:DUF917 domain-containing protein n=1 Tax=Aerococcus mictus TaxID=2976810 RepID=UPI000DCE7371|nr:DUF917 domain-containing protein [Aerococcus mictus]KAA9233714.1 DUF917 domain-containing protein [Aerococcus mictus]MDL5183823.1 DUF917 domain-containing protein [Aerococcus mictus]
MRLLDKEAVEKISIGAAFLGTGGGGDPYIGKLMALSAIKKHGPVKLISVDEVEEDGVYLPSASMGAPSILLEKFPAGDEFIKTFEKLSNFLGVEEISGTFPMEAGGVNSMIPIAVAASTGLPVVDVDGMGRAFPELQMTTFHLGGKTVSPMTMADEKGNNVVYETIDNIWAERIARVVTSEMGGSSLVSLYPSTGADLKEVGIQNIVTLSEKIGRIISSDESTEARLEKLLAETHGVELMSGKIIDISRTVKNGFNFGEIKIEGYDQYENSQMTVYFQNEYLVASKDGEIVVTTPDLITLVEVDTLEPATSDSLKYGKRVRVLGLPADKKWKTELGIKTVGPRYFGYDFDYKPIEELNKEVSVNE